MDKSKINIQKGYPVNCDERFKKVNVVNESGKTSNLTSLNQSLLTKLDQLKQKLEERKALLSNVFSKKGILDSYTGAAFAFAPDTLIYSGFSVTDNTVGSNTNGDSGAFTVLVRRSSDNALQSFTWEEVGDGTLVTWVGAGNDGFVQVAYDQSGNDNHVTQIAASNQPKIVDNGSLVVENGKAALDFLNDLLSGPPLISINQWSTVSVIKFKQSSSFQSIINQHPGNVVTGRTEFQTLHDSGGFRIFFNNGTSYSAQFSPKLIDSKSYILSSRAVSNNYFLSVNNSTEEQVITGQALTPFFTNLNIGALGNGLLDFEGKIQLIAIWTSDENVNQIKSAVNTEYSIY